MNDELFTFVDLDSKASEHISSPHYSYWKSVFRKFFSSKTAIFFLALSLIVILMALIYPSVSGFNPAVKAYVNDFQDVSLSQTLLSGLGQIRSVIPCLIRFG